MSTGELVSLPGTMSASGDRCRTQSSDKGVPVVDLVLVRRGAIALTVVVSLAAAPSALASGGVNSGGVNSGGAGGGGGTTAPTSASCAQITSFSNTTAYNWGLGTRIDTPYTIDSSCSGSVTADVTYTNQLTGQVDLERSMPLAAGTIIGSFEYADAPFSTPYAVTLSVIDATFNKLTSRSASITTKKPQQATS
jgi:hypothetical protein